VKKLESRDARFVESLQKAFTEISETFEMIKDIEVYTRRFPYRDTRVSKKRYLVHCQISLIHEVYILRERLAAFLKRVSRLYSKDRRAGHIVQTTEELRQRLLNAYESATRLRSDHVHKSRYCSRRDTLLGMLSALGKYDATGEKWRKMHDEEFRKLRADQLSGIKTLLHALGVYLDSFFSRLEPIVFDSEGVVRFPSHWPKRQLSN
jgi:hypothetical protein